MEDNALTIMEELLRRSDPDGAAIEMVVAAALWLNASSLIERRDAVTSLVVEVKETEPLLVSDRLVNASVVVEETMKLVELNVQPLTESVPVDIIEVVRIASKDDC